MGVLASVLNNFGITLGYLYLLMGIIVAPAVIPIAFTFTWSKQSATGAIAGSLGAFACGLLAWLVSAKVKIC
jgi:Na+/proline symporter